MDREKRFEIMAAGPSEPLVVMADRLLDSGVELEITRQPHPAIMMIRARETAKGEIFNFGEALVTEAEVQLQGGTGYMLVLGSDRMHALAGAICDAALEASHPLSPDILETLTLLSQLQQEKDAAEWAAIAATKVNFDEMEA
jgi:alpha-D-ribose 1-methylphosphonate 5-triphosphate synthase subunit PhnG